MKNDGEMDEEARLKKLAEDFNQTILEQAEHLIHTNASKQYARRKQLSRELLDSEKEYFFYLLSITENYKKLQRNPTIISGKESKTLFQNIDEIIAFSHDLYISLEKEFSRTSAEADIELGRIFQNNPKIPSFLQIFTQYLKGLPQAYHLYYKLKKSNPEFLNYIDNVVIENATNIKEEFKLENLLLLPLLRMYYYDRLFKELELLPPLTDAKEQLALTKTQDLMKELYDTFQEDKRTKQSLAKELLLPKAEDYYLFDWKTAFLSILLTELAKNPENFLRECPLKLLLTANRVPVSCYVYLFREYIVLSQTLAGTSKNYYYAYYSLLDAEIEQEADTHKLANVFNIKCKRCTLKFCAPTKKEMQLFITDLKKHLGQKDKERKSRSITFNDPTVFPSPSMLNALKVQHNIGVPVLQNFVKDLPDTVKTKKASNAIVELLEGPTLEDPFHTKPKRVDGVAAHCVNLFPFDSRLNAKFHQPINDKYAIATMKNKTCIVVCDAQRQGSIGENTAATAAKVALSKLTRNLALSNVQQTGDRIVRSLAAAHEALLLTSETTTTSILAGILVETVDSSDSLQKNFNFVVGSIGNCVCYTINAQREFKEIITPSSNTGDLGCIGRFLSDNSPNLSDFRINYCPMNTGEYVIVMTDGIDDNFDPQYLGLSVPELVGFLVSSSETDYEHFQRLKSWDGMNPESAVTLKLRYKKALMKQLIADIELNVAATPKKIVRALVDYATKVTQHLRNQKTRHPLRHANASGKSVGRLDHGTCVCLHAKERL